MSESFLENSKVDMIKLRQLVEKFQVAVVTHDNKRILEQGSGVLIKHLDKYLILTAAHVVNGYSIDQIQIIHSKSVSNIKTHIVSSNSLGGGWNEPNDVAYLQISEETASHFKDRTFLSRDQVLINLSITGEELFLVSGLPGAEDYTNFGKYQGLNKYSYTPLLYATKARSTERWHGSTNSDFEIEIEWPFEVNDALHNNKVKLPNPKGMSGGGLWKLDSPSTLTTTSDWANRIKLTGINTTYIEEHDYVRSEKLDSIYYLAGLYD